MSIVPLLMKIIVDKVKGVKNEKEYPETLLFSQIEVVKIDVLSSFYANRREKGH